MVKQSRFRQLLFIWLALVSCLTAQELYVGMPEQEIYFEMKGYPTSTAESQDRKFLIYPNGIRIILRQGQLVSAEGIEVLEEKPPPGNTDVEPQPAPEPAPAPAPAPNPVPAPPESAPAVSVPAFPSENPDEPLPEALVISEEEETRLKALSQPPVESAPAESESTDGAGSASSEFDFGETGTGGSPQGVAFLVEFLIGTVITLVILKIAVSLVGVTAFLPGLIAIAVTDTLVRLGTGALFTAMAFPLGGPVQILVSFVVLLYLVKGFTSAREWPTIIQVVVTTKVVGFVAFWLLAMFVLNY